MCINLSLVIRFFYWPFPFGYVFFSAVYFNELFVCNSGFFFPPRKIAQWKFLLRKVIFHSFFFPRKVSFRGKITFSPVSAFLTVIIYLYGAYIHFFFGARSLLRFNDCRILLYITSAHVIREFSVYACFSLAGKKKTWIFHVKSGNPLRLIETFVKSSAIFAKTLLFFVSVFISSLSVLRKFPFSFQPFQFSELLCISFQYIFPYNQSHSSIFPERI